MFRKLREFSASLFRFRKATLLKRWLRGQTEDIQRKGDYCHEIITGKSIH
jgi:hypothetical protein